MRKRTAAGVLVVLLGASLAACPGGAGEESSLAEAAAAAERTAAAAPGTEDAFFAERSSATYTVRANDTLAAIARRYRVRAARLLEANPELAEDPRRVRIGETVVIPLE